MLTMIIILETEKISKKARCRKFQKLNYKVQHLRCDVVTRGLFRLFMRHIRDDFNSFMEFNFDPDVPINLDSAIVTFIYQKFPIEEFKDDDLHSMKKELKLMLSSKVRKHPALYGE